ncbi:MAG TPA: hypothetical protein VF037_10495 [Gemmatimonadales bacterium]
MRRPDEEERPIRPEELKGRLALVQDTVKKLEAEVASGTIPSEGMEDFKRAIDEARMRIWAVLMSANDSDPAVYLERFRFRRAIEICRAIHRDLDDGHLQAPEPEAKELAQVVRALGNALEGR